MTVVRYWDGPFLKYAHTGPGVILSTPFFGGNHFAKMHGNRLKDNCALPDLGALVLERFVARTPGEVPQWPEMMVKAEPVDEGFVAGQGFTVVIMVSDQQVGPYRYSKKGYAADVVIEIKGRYGEVLFWRWYFFEPDKNGMNRSLEELEAEGCRVLKEDMAIAADRTVDDFISALKGD